MGPLGWGGEAVGGGEQRLNPSAPSPSFPGTCVWCCRSLVTHIRLVPEPGDAEGFQQVTATQQQDPQLWGGGQSWHRGERRSGKHSTLSLAPDKYRSLPFLGLQHPAPPGSPAPWCVQCSVWCAQCRQLCLAGSSTDHSYPPVGGVSHAGPGGSWFAWY